MEHVWYSKNKSLFRKIFVNCPCITASIQPWSPLLLCRYFFPILLLLFCCMQSHVLYSEQNNTQHALSLCWAFVSATRSDDATLHCIISETAVQTNLIAIKKQLSWKHPCYSTRYLSKEYKKRKVMNVLLYSVISFINKHWVSIFISMSVSLVSSNVLHPCRTLSLHPISRYRKLWLHRLVVPFLATGGTHHSITEVKTYLLSTKDNVW